MESEPVFEEEERTGVEDDHQWAEDGLEEQWGGQMVRFVWRGFQLIRTFRAHF